MTKQETIERLIKALVEVKSATRRFENENREIESASIVEAIADEALMAIGRY